LPLLGSLLIVVTSMLAGTILALLGAWRGGAIDELIARTLDIVFAFPGVLLAILAVAIFRPGVVPAALALAIAHVPYVTRVLRSVAVRERNLPYVKALEVQGLGWLAIWTRHLIRNLAPHIVSQALLTFAGAFVALTALSFLGISVTPPTADWGAMLADGQNGVLSGHSTEAIVAGVSIVVLVAAVNVLGESLVSSRDEK
jgi:peptide/nickel transport system permease protein